MMLVPFHRWTKAHDLLIQQAIRKDQLAIMVNESDAMLRWEDFPKNSYTVLLNSGTIWECLCF